MKHYLYSASATKFAPMHKTGIVPESLESAYFDKVIPGDVIWIVEVWNADDSGNEDALILGRFLVDRVTRIGKKTTVHSAPSSTRKLTAISLAKHKIYLECCDTSGGTGGMCSSSWGTPYNVGGAFAHYERWVRTGWRLDDSTARKLETVWIEETKSERTGGRSSRNSLGGRVLTASNRKGGVTHYADPRRMAAIERSRIAAVGRDETEGVIEAIEAISFDVCDLKAQIREIRKRLSTVERKTAKKNGVKKRPKSR